jgi:hypothetical protein
MKREVEMISVVFRLLGSAVGLPLLAYCLGGVASVSEILPAGDLAIPFTSVPDTHLLRWAGGVIVRVDREKTATPVLCRFDRTGARLPDLPFSIPGVDVIAIGNIAVAQDGRVAVHGSAFDRKLEKYTGFLSLISGDGQQQVTIRTFPYYVNEMVFGPDGVLWTAGFETDGVQVLDNDHAIIRRWDASGRVIGSLAPRHEIRAPKPDNHPTTQAWFAVSKDRVGWYTAIARVYIEYSLDGKQLGRYKAVELPNDARYKGIAMTNDGSVFVSASYPSTTNPKLYARDVWVLDRERASWVALAKKGPLASGDCIIIGAEGPHLVVYVERDKLRLLLPSTLTNNP